MEENHMSEQSKQDRRVIHDTLVCWVRSAERLVEMLAEIGSPEFVTLDTEFIRVSTFYPELALLQLYDGKVCYLIDPLDNLDLKPLAALFEDQECTKIMHAPSEDVEIFHLCGLPTPSPLFDTQLAELFDPSDATGGGLQALVEHYMGISLDKGETRSDWLQRPLSESQLGYAVNDVVYLHALAQKRLADMQQDDKASVRLGLCLEEAQWRYGASPESDFESYYLSMRKAAHLPPRSQQILRELAAWREHEARSRNLPRKKVCDDDLLIQIAQEHVISRDALQRLRQRQQGLAGLRRYGETLIELAAAVLAEDTPKTFELIQPPLPKAFKPTVKRVKAYLADQAVENGLAPEAFGGRKQVEELIRANTPELASAAGAPTLTTNWRGRLLLPEINDLARTPD